MPTAEQWRDIRRAYDEFMQQQRAADAERRRVSQEAHNEWMRRHGHIAREGGEMPQQTPGTPPILGSSPLGTTFRVRSGSTRATAMPPPVAPAAPLNIDAILAMPPKNFIYRVGVELEGGWVKLPKGVELHGDGSVQDIQLTPEEKAKNQAVVDAGGTLAQMFQLRTGELQSVPMDPRELESWMQQSYPSHVNETCGLHVHMSFKSALHYMWLMVPEYQATVKEYIRRWAEATGIDTRHTLFDRLRGANTYCRDEFYPDGQAAKVKKNYQHEGASRYTMINYCHGLHGTLECRLLPMFDRCDVGVDAVRQVLAITNACITACAMKEDAVEATPAISDEETAVVEVSQTYIPGAGIESEEVR